MTPSRSEEVGRVLYASTTEYAFGCHVAQAREGLPAFGALVCSESARAEVYGLVYDVRVNDDPFVRQLVVAPSVSDEYIEDQRQNRQVPVEVATLAVGYRANGRVTPALPPHPPMSLDRVFACAPDELTAFAQTCDYYGLVLDAGQVPAEELLAAHVRIAAAALAEPRRRTFLVRAGKELARLLAGDLLRLQSILRRVGAEG